MVLVIPVSQMVIFLGLIAICFLLARYKLGLSITFCFTFFWGYVSNKDVFFTDLEKASPFLIIYFGCGILLILLALWSFFVDEE